MKYIERRAKFTAEISSHLLRHTSHLTSSVHDQQKFCSLSWSRSPGRMLNGYRCFPSDKTTRSPSAIKVVSVSNGWCEKQAFYIGSHVRVSFSCSTYQITFTFVEPTSRLHSVESFGSEKKDQMTSSCSPLESRQSIDKCSNVSLKRYQIGFLWSVTFDHVINQCMTFSQNEHEALCVCFTIEIVKWDDLSM